MKRLPSTVEEIASIIGRDDALRLVDMLPHWQAGPNRAMRPILYVPKRMTQDHRLAKILGMADAMRLAAEFGGEILQLGNCKGLHRQARDAMLQEERARGIPAALVAGRAAITVRQLRNIVNQAPAVGVYAD